MTDRIGSAADVRIRRLPWYVPLFGPIARVLLARGVPLGFNGLITVRGRKSGLPRTTPVAIIEVAGRRWVWAPWGEVQWVRNLRAAGDATITFRRRENALPLIMTHGWPGSVVELLETIGPLTDPTAHGGHAEDAFHLVLPSIPGYGFSAEPAELGWGPIRIGQAWPELMQRLGYTRYVAQGGDVGSQVTDAMGRLGLDGLIGIHTNLLTPALGDAVALSASPPSKEERAALDQLDAFHATGTGYFVEQATRPQTIGYALLDSPIALAAWMIDHDTDAYEKIARAFVDGQPSGNLTRERIVDNITLYWLTGTGASAARSYWEEGAEGARAAGHAPTPVSVPVGFTTFPGEIWRTPRSWAEKSYPTLTYFNEVDKGGHFAAWEEPQLFSEEIRAAFRPLQQGH